MVSKMLNNVAYTKENPFIIPKKHENIFQPRDYMTKSYFIYTSFG